MERKRKGVGEAAECCRAGEFRAKALIHSGTSQIGVDIGTPLPSTLSLTRKDRVRTS